MGRTNKPLHFVFTLKVIGMLRPDWAQRECVRDMLARYDKGLGSLGYLGVPLWLVGTCMRRVGFERGLIRSRHDIKCEVI